MNLPLFFSDAHGKLIHNRTESVSIGSECDIH